MNWYHSILIIWAIIHLQACGFKGNLYHANEDDSSSFSPIQSGFELKAPPIKNEKPLDKHKINEN